MTFEQRLRELSGREQYEYIFNRIEHILALVEAARKTCLHNGSAQRAIEQSGLRQAIAALDQETP